MSEMTLPMAERWARSWNGSHPDVPLADRAAMTLLMAEYDQRRVEIETLREHKRALQDMVVFASVHMTTICAELGLSSEAETEVVLTAIRRLRGGAS